MGSKKSQEFEIAERKAEKYASCGCIMFSIGLSLFGLGCLGLVFYKIFQWVMASL